MSEVPDFGEREPVVRDRRLAYVEGPRALAEIAALAATSPYLTLAPRGDGHPVLVMPGFGASDASTAVLRQYLAGQGFAPRSWQLGRTLGPAMADLDLRLADRLREVWLEGGRRKVSLVGWSLGGVYARLLAHRFPEAVRQVITLGSPIGLPDPDRAERIMSRMSEGGLSREDAARLRRVVSDPLPDVPGSAVYSRTDGVVPWQIARQVPSAIADNVEVFSSHIGLGFNPATLYLLAERLAQPETAWRPFQRSGWRRLVFGPDAA